MKTKIEAKNHFIAELLFLLVVIMGLFLAGCNANSTFKPASELKQEPNTQEAVDDVTDKSEEQMKEWSQQEDSAQSPSQPDTLMQDDESAPQDEGQKTMEESPLEKKDESPSVQEPQETVSQKERLYRVGLQDYSLESFNQAVKNNETVLVDVYASWCPTCQANVPHLTAAVSQANNAGGKVVVFQVNYDKDRDFLKTYGVPVQSTYVLFKNGGEAMRVHGLMTQKAFADLIS